MLRFSASEIVRRGSLSYIYNVVGKIKERNARSFFRLEPMTLGSQEPSSANSLGRVAWFRHRSIRPHTAMITDCDPSHRRRPVAQAVFDHRDQ
jgi:hypothetical protein